MANRVTDTTEAEWVITYDNGNQADYYDDHPGEFEIRTAQRAAPDAWTELRRMVDGWKEELVERRPPLTKGEA